MTVSFAAYTGILQFSVLSSVTTLTTDRCATEPTGNEESSEPVSLVLHDALYTTTSGETYAVYDVVCGGFSGLILIESIFRDGSPHISDSIQCGGTLYVPEYTTLVVVYDQVTGATLAEKQPPIEISDPQIGDGPTVVYVAYLPVIVK